MKQKLKYIPIVVLVLLIITGLCYSFHIANAAEGFKTVNDNWSGISNKMSEDAIETYPYDGSTDSHANITSVSLDILYGTTRKLVTYHGEIPERETTTDDGKYVDAFQGIYYRGGTSLKKGTDVNPGKVSSKDYWGFNEDDTNILALDGDKHATKTDMENVNKDEVISLRLYCLTNTTESSQWAENLLYLISQGAAGIASGIIKLTIAAKSIDMGTIFNLLHMQNLADLLTKNFIYDGTHTKLSAFTAFCIIMFIFALVSYTYNYIKGGNKENDLLSILGTALIGLLIIGMCLSGRIYTLGSSVSDMASKLLYVTAGTLSEDGDGNTFTTMITDNKNENKVIQLQEMSMINKSFIKLQICTQFGVTNIDELKFSAFGDSNGAKAKAKLSGISNADLKKDFNNNLGYYFWFADSSAKSKTSLNTEYPATNTIAAKKKLNSMMTYLQVMYNNARNNNQTAKQEKIKNIALTFANPNGTKGFLTMALYVVILAVLAVCLFRYALSVMISKLELFASILGMTVAGPLMLTTNKKLANTGRNILGITLVSFINITVYSIIFDIILYVIASMISTDPISLLVTLAAVILLLKFNPIIAEKIKQLLDRAENSIAPNYSQTKRAFKGWTRTKANDMVNKYDNSKRIAGYDANGNRIYEQRGGNALSKLMHQGMNAVYGEGSQHESMRKINKRDNETRDRNVRQSSTQLYKAAEAQTNKTKQKMKTEASVTANAIEFEKKKLEQSIYEDVNGERVYNTENLNKSETELYNKINISKQEADNIANSETFKKLVEEKMKIDEYNDKLPEGEEKKQFDKAAELAKLNMKIQARKQAAANAQTKLNSAIDERTSREAFKANGFDFDKAEGESLSDKISYVSTYQAQQKFNDELRDKLTAQIGAAGDAADIVSTGKIGATAKEVNKDAVASQASAQMQLNDLDNGKLLSNDEEYRNEANKIAKQVEYQVVNSAFSEDITEANNKLKQAYKIQNKTARKNAVEQAKQEIENAKSTHEQVKQNGKQVIKNVKQEKRDNKQYIEAAGKVLVSEQIAQMIKDRETTNPIKPSTNPEYNKDNDTPKPENPIPEPPKPSNS